MNWWVIPIVGALGVLGLFAGWAVGTIVLALRDEPMDVWWDDWDDDE